MAITKLYTPVELFTSGGKRFNVNGFSSAKLTINITSVISGELRIGIYDSPTQDATYTSSRAKAYYKGELLTSNLGLRQAGEHEIHIDTENANSVYVAVTESGFDGNDTRVFSSFYEKLSENKTTPVSSPAKKGGYIEYIDLSPDSKQIDIEINTFQEDATGYFRLTGTKDGATWESVPFLEPTTGQLRSSNQIAVAQKVTIYANIEGYRQLKFHIDASSSFLFYPKISVSNEYLDRWIVPSLLSAANRLSFFKGYKYFSFDLAGYRVKDSSLRVNLFAYDESDELIRFNVYNRNMERFRSYWFSQTATTGAYELFGDVIEGGFVAELEEPCKRAYPQFNEHHSLATKSRTTKVRLHLSTERPEEKPLPILREKNDYKIYQLPSDSTAKDVYGNDVLEFTTDSLKFWMGGYFGICYEIPFTADNVPSILAGELIKFAYLLPFNLSNRSAGVGDEQNASRIVVFTNKGRILHNFPARISGNLPNSDLFKFEESTVYNSFKKWLPTNDKGKAGGLFRYFPVLADYDYNQFEGRVAGTTGFVDHFNTGGVPAMTNKPLFDVLIKDGEPLRRLTYANMAKDSKLCVFANYNSANGSEPIAIGTNDGGKTWHTKAYFAQTDYYNYMRAGNITFTPITDVAGAYVANSLKLCRKRFNVPTNEIKEPATPFVVNEADKTLITNISVSDNTVLITTADNVDYDGIYPVVYFENVNADSEWNYICNNGFNASGSTNNGIFFRVKKVAANQYLLYGDTGDAYQSDLICRHLHAVNRVQNGFLVSTGEGYRDEFFAGGFLYLISQVDRNGGSIYLPNKVMPVIRLTSSVNAVNRACGAYLFNDGEDPTLIYASDEPTTFTSKRTFTIPDRTIEIDSTPIGIFMGKLSEIDNQAKYKCICELKQTIISLFEHMGHFAADGMEDALCISKDGLNWNIETLSPARRINGTDWDGNIYFGDKVIVFK